MNDPEQHISEFEEETFDALGIALAIAENALLLLLVPLLIGLLSYGGTFALPQRFESVSVVRAITPIASTVDGEKLPENPAMIPASVAAFMTTDAVIDGAALKTAMTPDASVGMTERMRDETRKKIDTQLGNDQTITLITSDDTPVKAQRLANAILELTFVETRPKSAERTRLVSELSQLEKREQYLAAASQRVRAAFEQGGSAGDVGRLGESYALILSQLSQIQRRILSIQVRLEGLTNEALLQSPTLPTAPVSPKRSMIAVLSTLVSGLLMLIFVLIRESWRKSYASGQHQARIAALKQRYGFGR
jgi:hypothetical protein